LNLNAGIVLRALDGSNPLAFLAALGTLRLLTLSHPDTDVQMRWERMEGFWRPRLLGTELKEGLCGKLAECPHWAPAEDFTSIGKNLTVPKGALKEFVTRAHRAAKSKDRRAADFASSFGCEICVQEGKDRIEYTDLCFITGSGQQDFLGTIKALQQCVTAKHIYDALFGEWKAEKGLSMRWDPSDASEYALQWDDPSPKGAQAVWGANRLAVEALPLFPTAPVTNGLRTTGFSRRRGRDEFTWPIWEHSIGLGSVRSLLSFPELQEDAPERPRLLAMGIREIYRAQRVRIGQGANFKVSFRPARTA
jgi:hypothetical protein